MFFDAHNHLQHRRFDGRRNAVLAASAAVGVAEMAVNGTGPGDWAAVAELVELAQVHGVRVWPQFGVHPWRVARTGDEALADLRGWLERWPEAGVGEVGLDRWMRGLDWERQLVLFRRQLELAAELDRPLSIHCLKAWGALLDELRRGPLPRRGLALHGFGGDWGVASRLLELHPRVYFSFSGYFLLERKAAVREAFARMPPERVLLESDAPDMAPPAERVEPRWNEPNGETINAPTVLPEVAELAAEWLPGRKRLRENAREFFGGSGGTGSSITSRSGNDTGG